MEKVVLYCNGKFGEVLFLFLFRCILFYIWKNKYKFVKKKCNSSMIMYVILNVLWIVFLNIVYNGIMRFIY